MMNADVREATMPERCIASARPKMLYWARMMMATSKWAWPGWCKAAKRNRKVKNRAASAATATEPNDTAMKVDMPRHAFQLMW